MKFTIVLLSSLILLLACAEQTETIHVPSKEINPLIAATLEASGGKAYEESTVSFDFRDKSYKGHRDGGDFQLERLFEDTLGKIHDIYTNTSFSRTINGKEISLPDTLRSKYEQSINSVFYFALLPYKLDDPAVKITSLGKSEIKGRSYRKLLVSFAEEDGGQDHDDNFIYWIDEETDFIHYLAYEYATNGGGMRFRSLYNERIIGGIRFTNAINMKPIEKGSVKLSEIDQAYEKELLKELSRIELENIAVE